MRTRIQSPDIAPGAISLSKLQTLGSFAGTYTAASVTVNNYGIITSISAGTPFFGTVSPGQISPQGTGSGLDADTVDGQHASAFASSSHTHTLVSLTDVSPGTPTNGQVLTWHAASSQWRSSSPGSIINNLGDLLDVSPTAPATGEALFYNATSGRWYNASPGTIAGASTLADLTDVSPVGVTNGQVLTYNTSSGQWYGASPASGGVSDHGALTGLADDDHLQYLTSPRADSWLAGKTTANLTEGANLYYTDERAQDAFGATVSPSTTIRWSYNDTAGKIQAFVSPANISHALLSNLTTGDPHTQYLLESGVTGITISPDQIAPQGTGSGLDADTVDGQHASAFSASGHTHTLVQLTDVSPTTPTTGQVLIYNATSGQWYNASPTTYVSFTAELAQDAVGGALTNTSTIKWTYNDGSNTISADVSPASISHANLSNLTVGDPHTQYQLESGIPALSFSPGQITPQGTGSGFDADTVDGQHASDFAASGHTHTLAQLTDVSPSSLINGQVLTWDDASSQWINATPASGVTDHGLLTGLTDDDHPQYFNSPRSDTWLTTKTTSNLTEGSNLYFTDERTQDVVGAMVSPSSTIRWSYNDTAGKIQAFVSPANISHASLADLTTGDPHTQYQLESGIPSLTFSPDQLTPQGTGSGIDADLLDGQHASAFAVTAHTHTIVSLTDVSPTAPTTGQVLMYNGASAQWYNASPTVYVSFTAELAEDAIAAALTDTSTIRWSYNDGTGELNADVSPANINHASLSNLTVGDPHTQYQLESGIPALDFSPGQITPQGTGSGLDADTVDGQHASAFATSAHTHTIAQLTDVSPTTPTTGQVLTYNAVSGQWRNVSPTVGVTDHGLLSGLADDDHTQYHNDTRAGTWLALQDIHSLADVSPKDVTNGQVLTWNNASARWYNASPVVYTSFTNELAQDAVGSILTNTSTLKWTYNDGANTISADVSPASISHNSLSTLTTGDPHTQYQLKSEKGQANGYLGLNASSYASPAKLGSGPAVGKVLYGDNTWASPPSGGSLTLAQLTDVSPTSVTNGQVLTYNGTSSRWVNASPSVGGASTLNDLTDVDLLSETEADFLIYLDGIWTNAPRLITGDLVFIIDGGGAVIQPYEIFYLPVSFNGTFTGWTMVADQSGSMGCEVWASSYAGAPPDSSDRISGSPANPERPNLSSEQKNRDLSISGTWTTAFSAGDMLAIYIQSPVTSVTRVTLTLRYRKAVE